MWWAREDSNLQPSGYERRTFTGIINRYWRFRVRSLTIVRVWLRRIIGYLLVERQRQRQNRRRNGQGPVGVETGHFWQKIVRRRLQIFQASLSGSPLELPFFKQPRGTSRRACLNGGPQKQLEGHDGSRH